jgi:hypothetical protein
VKCLALGISLIKSVLLTIILTNFRDILSKNDIVGDNLPPVLTYLGLIIVRSLTTNEFNSKNILSGPLAFAQRQTLYQRRIAKVRIATQKVTTVEFLRDYSFEVIKEVESLHLYLNRFRSDIIIFI